MPISLSAGGGGPANSGSSAGVGTPISTPNAYDGSGWVVNFGNGNSNDARGGTGANTTAQNPQGLGGGGLLGNLGFDPKLLLLAAAAYLILTRR